MKYLLSIAITLLIIGCGNEKDKEQHIKNDNHSENIVQQSNIKQPSVPQTKNEKLRPPSIPQL